MRFAFPHLTASDWLVALSDEYNPEMEVIPGLLDDECYDKTVDALESGQVSLKQLQSAARKAISVASGFDWWEAIRLVGLCDANPEVMGEMTLRGVNPDVIPFGRWCSALYALATRNLDDKEKMKFLSKFSVPPPNVDDVEETGMSFESMVTSMRGIPGMRMG